VALPDNNLAAGRCRQWAVYVRAQAPSSAPDAGTMSTAPDAIDMGRHDARWLESGQLGPMIAAHGWSATPLGPLDRWPHSLRTAVNLILHSQHPMWLGWGPEATFLYNDAYIGVLGEAKHRWALGRPAAEVWAEIWDVCGPLADQVFAHGKASFVDDVRLYMRRGDFFEETFYSFSYSPIYDEEGRIAGLFCPSAEQTSKILNARRLATLSSLAAKALAERDSAGACSTAMRIIGENTDDIPFAGLYLQGNGCFVLQQATGTGGDTLPLVLDADRGDWAWAVANAIRSGEAQGVAVPPSLVAVDAAGQRVSQALILPLVASGQGQAFGALVAGINPGRSLDAEYRTFFTLVAAQTAGAIANAQVSESERKRAEALTELDRAKTLFFSNISHELRTPLTLVLGPLEEALGDETDASQRERLQLVQRNAHRLLRLVNTLLDFSRIEAGKTRAVYEQLDLPALTAELAGTFRSAIERAGLVLRVELQALAEPVFVDRDMWEKIVLNLLSNAFKFTFEGEIAVSLGSVGAEAVLEVRDTGVGIPAREIPHLFERFHRVEGARSRTQEGTGIGLALVQELVKLHGGAMEVESAEGAGSAFRVRIPLGRRHLPAQADADTRTRASTAARAGSFTEEAERWTPQPGEPAAPERPAGTTDGAAPLVLLADDNADMRDYVRRLLAERYRVVSVADGLTALETARRSSPDLVVSDVMMPGLDGFELLHALRGEAATREMPIVLLSARAGEEARIEGLRAGADDYLVKPFSAKELIAKVESQLKLVQLRREARNESEVLNQVSSSLSSELDMSVLLQKITDAGTRLTGARFGAFLHNTSEGQPEPSALYTLSGAPLDALELLGRPRVTPIFAPTFRGEGVIRSDDVHQDPHFGQLPGHLPFRSYLAVPVTLRSGEVIGGLFFGHPEPGVFDRRAERLIQGMAGQAAVALDNARMFEASKRDAEERRQLLESERAARAEAERLSATKDEFLATLSHELRTPLNAIMGWAEVLSRSRIGEQDLRRGVEAIHRNARSQAQLIEDLLDMNRIASGKIRLDVQSVLPLSFIEGAAEAVRPAAEAKGIRLEVVADPLAGPVSGDPSRLQQVIWNLLSNAIKFTPKGGKVQVLLQRINSHIEISVSDTGHGIDPEFLPHVFERFRQADSSATRKYGGLGLGLAIVKHLVELHGGTVQASSPGPGNGATFTVCLPLSILRQPEDAEERVHPRSSRGVIAAIGGVDLAGVCVMVVDDDADARELIGRMLGEYGAQVITAESGGEALERLAETRPDVLISDIGMPEMDGYDLLRRIRATGPQQPQPRAIALTAFARTEDRTRALLAGFLSHLAKPVEPAELIATVAVVAGRAVR
jgi:signal transduction histidine kinase/CheY-like chemotaxis protein